MTRLVWLDGMTQLVWDTLSVGLRSGELAGVHMTLIDIIGKQKVSGIETNCAWGRCLPWRGGKHPSQMEATSSPRCPQYLSVNSTSEGAGSHPSTKADPCPYMYLIGMLWSQRRCTSSFSNCPFRRSESQDTRMVGIDGTVWSTEMIIHCCLC